LFYHLTQIGAEAAQKLRDRVAKEITTIFSSRYTREISLAEALSVETIRAYQRKATGEKYLIVPWKE
ncbi:NADH oxidase, partial [Acinetobacter baumannii]